MKGAVQIKFYIIKHLSLVIVHFVTNYLNLRCIMFAGVRLCQILKCEFTKSPWTYLRNVSCMMSSDYPERDCTELVMEERKVTEGNRLPSAAIILAALMNQCEL